MKKLRRKQKLKINRIKSWRAIHPKKIIFGFENDDGTTEEFELFRVKNSQSGINKMHFVAVS